MAKKSVTTSAKKNHTKGSTVARQKPASAARAVASSQSTKPKNSPSAKSQSSKPEHRKPQSPKNKKSVKFSFTTFRASFSRVVRNLNTRRRNLIARRPHRSFRRTHKHDMPITPPVPGVFALTAEVLALARRFWKAAIFFIITYAIASSLIVGFIQQDNYLKIASTIQDVGAQVLRGQYDRSTELVSAAGVILIGGLNGQLTEAQQLSMLLLALITWLCVVWYLRHQLAGRPVALRDALYNAGAPLIPSLLIGFVILLQLLPALIGWFLYVTAAFGDVLQPGIESMGFGLAVILLTLLSLYWVTASEFALIIVTVQGVYPMTALREAGDLAAGKRLPLALRLIWLLLMIVVVWLVVLVPTLWLTSWADIPLVPVVAQLLSGATAVFASSYIYLLYRRLINV